MQRPKYLKDIHRCFRVHPACAILGPRQVGKTTLAHMFLEKYPPDQVHFFDLENPLDLARLEQPMLTLSKLSRQLIVIDEIQRRPELFPVLRVLIDEQKDRKFLILGSASRDLIRQSSETLAGRIAYLELMPFNLEEVDQSARLFLRGGYPRSYLAANEEDSFAWRKAYISTFLERDIPNLGFSIPAQQMRRFWLMLAHYHGQTLNVSELSKSMGLTDHTIRKYLDVLAGTFMIRILAPWHENLSKRQVKLPKIYFRDSGILHALLGLQSEADLDVHPKLGAFWEGFALEEIIRQLGAESADCYFWGTPAGPELDLLVMIGNRKIGFECKYTDQPRVTRSMKIALEDLQLDHIYVVFPGSLSFPIDEKISAHGLELSLPKF